MRHTLYRYIDHGGRCLTSVGLAHACPNNKVAVLPEMIDQGQWYDSTDTPPDIWYALHCHMEI